MDDDRGFFETFIGDGRSLIKLTALALIGAGAFAVFQASTGQFLPQDTDYLGMTAAQLCALRACRIVHFMVHDRVSFGGVLIAIGVMYLWLAEFPLRRREAWAWWALVISGSAGFLSFLAYLGYGYLDSWHGAATLGLLPLFAAGLVRTRNLRVDRVPRPAFDMHSRRGVGRILLLLTTFGIVAAGFTIMTVGMTSVFVPQDIAFMGITPAELHQVNPHLVPLIAHDRAGFGGALVSCGLAMFLAVLYGTPSRSLWQALVAAGVAGFCAAIIVHPLIGYTDLFHLGPAIAGCIVFFAGMAITAPARIVKSAHDATR
jgi:MFS family permease